MDDDQAGTGATMAVLVDTLLDLEVDADRVMQMTEDEKVAVVRAAAARGDLSPSRVETLRGFGIPV